MTQLVNLGDIIEPIHSVIKPFGFAKQGKRQWYKTAAELVQNVQLGKSTYGQQNWIRFYLSLRRFQAGGKPKSEDFCMVIEFDRLVKDQELLQKAFDQRAVDMSKEERFAVISNNLQVYGTPILKRLENESEIDGLYKEIRNRNTFSISKQALERLGIIDHP
jgi:hypothetical protein